jgi:nitrate/TMAO reductase-like tetraheme cytochrome c subunit
LKFFTSSKPKKPAAWPKIALDFSRPADRLKLVAGLIALLLVGIVLVTGGIIGYEFTESAEFCGTTCHSMDAQWVRYKHSPHANVRCADCHIGPGADFFVKSKLDGIRQVFAELMQTYQRPIKGPIHNLRPARETCETCHNPGNFKDNIVRTITHYDNNAENTPVTTNLILKMEGLEEGSRVKKGIHWHIDSKVYFIAADEMAQVILWVGVEQPDGSLKQFFSRDVVGMAQTSLVEKARAEGKVKLMDCINCHNRTAHYIPTPQEAVDQAINDRLISVDIPSIRAKSVQVLSKKYTSQAEALAAIDALGVELLASKPDPKSAPASYPAKVSAAVNELKQILSISVFPDANLDWKTNPNNDGHTPTLGCFRCHDDKHVQVDASGKEVASISVKCNLCHSVPIVGRGSETLVEAPVIVGSVPESHSDFRWTIEHRNISDADKLACYQCHGQGFCNNGACHNLSHPKDMLFSHAAEFRKKGNQVCYTCHQNITCSRCHAGEIQNP